ncbi:MAG: hypothetical protein WBA16_01915 [Nonlabens sp.]
MNWITRLFCSKPTKDLLSPIEFMGNYLENANKARILLDLSYKSQLISQIDPMQYNNAWFELINLSDRTVENQNKLVLYTVNGHPLFKKHDSKTIAYNFIDEISEGHEIRTFYKLIDKNITPNALMLEFKGFVNKFYMFNESDPTIDYFMHQGE